MRPDRPGEDKAPQLTDAVWHLAESCWAQNFPARPNADSVCNTISSLLSTATQASPLALVSSNSSNVDPSVSHGRVFTSRVSTSHGLSTSSRTSPPVSVNATASLIRRLSRTVVFQPQHQFLRLEKHTQPVRSVAFSPDGRRVASGSTDKTLCVWHAESGETIMQTPPLAESIRSISFSRQGEKIVTLGSKEICVWYADTGRTAAGPFQQRHVGWSAVFSPDAKQVVYGSSDNTIRIIDAFQSANPLRKLFRGHNAPVQSIAFSHDGRRLVSGSADKTIRIWNMSTRTVVVGPFQGHTDDIFSVAFSPDGRRIASGSKDNTIIIWEAGIARLMRILDGHTNWVYCVAFSPDGQRLVSSSADETIRIWDASTGSPIGLPLKWHTTDVYSVAFSPDGSRIVSGSGDGTVCIGDWGDS